VKKLLIIVLLLSLTRMGFAYADSNQPITIRNFFLGSTPSSNSNVNQVLALLVGPRGVPGPAGVAGRDGFVGMNGQDGKDGLPGAPGPVGPQGPAGAIGPQGPAGAIGPQGPAGAPGVVGTTVLAVAIAEGTSECSGLGGSKFVTGGTTTYACNGSSGSGGSGGTTFTFGQGRVQIGTCDGDAEVGFTFPTRWSGEDFFLNRVSVSGVDGRCIGATLKIYLKIKSSGTIFAPSVGYGLGDVLVCSHDLLASEPGLGANPTTRTDNQFSISGSSTCSHTDSSGNSLASIQLGAISTRDLGNWVGFEIS